MSASDMSIEERFQEAADALAEHPDMTLEILMVVYAMGVGAAMRATGQWPQRSQHSDQP